MNNNTRILLIEDGEYKSKSVLDFLKKDLDINDIGIAVSYSSAVKKLVSDKYDFAIIDMSLPTFDQKESEISSDFRALAGLDIARQIERRKIAVKYVFLTQFQSLSSGEDSMTLLEIDELAKSRFGDGFKGTIYYEHAGSKWKEKLKEFIVNG
ncbi:MULTISPECIES: response regulator transcription factor [Vibrio]|uniref:response regulator transcription factor n=1 Tax=Vibrio TaxID=662 RepID=UPI0008784ED0|nr:response regulator transcription factor [Vibrio mimicus]AOW81955.1 hypothetical protein VM_04140 [Vibrio mimicus]EGR5120538.1 response regulator transcription factor [Vibrio cholerae]HDL9492230.1 response regulator transcription factor [Vibrio cholerae]